MSSLLVGPYTPPYHLVSDVPSLRTLSELGVIFLMFSLGLDFSFHKLKRVGMPAIISGLLEVIFVLAIEIALGKALGWLTYDCIFLGAALSISSTTIIIKAMEELDFNHKPFAELVFEILIIEDLFAILLLAGLCIVVGTDALLSVRLIDSTIKLFIFVSSWFLVGYFLIPSLIRKLRQCSEPRKSHHCLGRIVFIIDLHCCLIRLFNGFRCFYYGLYFSRNRFN